MTDLFTPRKSISHRTALHGLLGTGALAGLNQTVQTA